MTTPQDHTSQPFVKPTPQTQGERTGQYVKSYDVFKKAYPDQKTELGEPGDDNE